MSQNSNSKLCTNLTVDTVNSWYQLFYNYETTLPKNYITQMTDQIVTTKCSNYCDDVLSHYYIVNGNASNYKIYCSIVKIDDCSIEE